MGSNRYNKPKGNVPDFTPRSEKKAVEVTIDKTPCLVCKKMTHGYGMWEEGNTCSRKCESQYVKPEGERNVQMVDCFDGRVFVPDSPSS